VGRSHECDFPADVEVLPVLTRPRVGPLPTSHAIDRAVRDVLRDALAVYEIDLDGLRAARPDVVVTQDLCDVCAVSLDDVRAAVARLARQDVELVNLHPTTLDGIWRDIQSVADALGRGEEGRALLRRLRARVDAIAERARLAPSSPSVLSIEWIEPAMIGGMWMPELIALAGARPLVTAPAEHAPTLDRARLAALDPDVVLIKPCGFALDRSLSELHALPRVLPWDSWRAVAEGRVYLADGNAFFNRPGPRIVESLEILAACAHPEAFRDFAGQHGGSFLQVGRDLSIRAAQAPSM
jgi:iron complex transport system substrate-binding protein